MQPPKRQKKRQNGGGGGGGGGGSSMPPPSPSPALKKRRVLDGGSSSSSSCCCRVSCRRHQEGPADGCVCLQVISQQWKEELKEEVKEELKEELKEEVMKEAIASILNGRLQGPSARIEQNLPPTHKLIFMNPMGDKIFTKDEVQAADEHPIKIKMILSDQECSNHCRLLSAKVRIFVLDGDFNKDNFETWTSKDFENHIVHPRDRVGVVLAGKLDLKLKDGEACLEKASFLDNSKFTRSAKFRLGVKLMENLGERVLEGVTEPFTVNEGRGKEFEKHVIPTLEDEVWRLEKIGKKGPLCMALKQSGITSVMHFLRQYYKDKKALRNILSKASDSFWTKMVNHAKKCDPGSALHSHFIEEKEIRLYFSSLGKIVGATVAGHYNAFGDLDKAQKDLKFQNRLLPRKIERDFQAEVKEWSKVAYESMTYDQPDYEMYNGQPRQINCNILQGLITPGPETTVPIDQTFHDAVEHEISEDNGFPGDHQQLLAPQRHGSRRMTALPLAQEKNQTDASLGIDIQLSSHPEIHYNASSVITPYCRPADENMALLHQEALAASASSVTVHQDDYLDPFLGGELFPEFQYASYICPSSPADIQFLMQNDVTTDHYWGTLSAEASELPADVRRGHRWSTFAALWRWLAKLRASLARLNQE